MPKPRTRYVQRPLAERLELAAQSMRAAHLLSCESTCRDAATRIAELEKFTDSLMVQRGNLIRDLRKAEDCLRKAVDDGKAHVARAERAERDRDGWKLIGELLLKASGLTVADILGMTQDELRKRMR